MRPRRVAPAGLALTVAASALMLSAVWNVRAESAGQARHAGARIKEQPNAGQITERHSAAQDNERRDAAPSESIAALAASAVFDVVLVGDSHLRQGIVPSMVSQRLGGLRVMNMAQPGMPLSPEFLRAGAAALNPESPVRCLAVAVSLATQRAPLRVRRTEFAAHRAPTAPLEQAAARLWPAWIAPYAPVPDGPRGERLRVSTLHADGWRERDFVRRRARGEGVVEERWNLLAQPFDRLMVGVNKRALEALAETGVLVVVFVLPSDVEEIEPLVEAWAGMSALEYARRICPPEGVVIELPFHAGDTYDGHHLHPDAARRTTRTLAEELARAIPGGRRPLAPSHQAPEHR